MDSKYCTENGALVKKRHCKSASDARPDLKECYYLIKSLKIISLNSYSKIGSKKFAISEKNKNTNKKLYGRE